MQAILHQDSTDIEFMPYEFNESQLANFTKQGKDLAAIKTEKAKETGVYYRLMIGHVKNVLRDIKRVVPGYNAAQGYELAGFAGFQGWNDLVDGSTYKASRIFRCRYGPRLRLSDCERWSRW